MDSIISSPVFGITLSLMGFSLGNYLYKRFENPLLNPMLISVIFIISVLLIFKIDYNDYKVGGDYIGFFLGPATVVLAVPLYKKLDLLIKNFLSIMISIFIGSLAGMLSVAALCYILGVDISILKSLVAKSVTMPIGLEVTKSLNGIPSITVIAIVITGILGAVFSPKVLSIFKINDPMSKGIAIGTSSHALGTSKAVELGETEGAMSSLSIGIAGIITIFLAPFIVKVIAFLF